MQWLAALVLLAASAMVLAAEPAVRPASNTEPEGKVGERPYEMAWAERKPEHPEVVDFENLEGWTAVGFLGCTADLYRSREEQMFGSYTGKAVYTGKTSASYFELRPPQPIPIPGDPSAAQLWVRGNNWGWISPPKTARTSVHAIVRDAKGEHFAISLGYVNFDYWFLMHATFVSPLEELTGRIHKEGQGDGKLDYPLSFVAFRITGCADEKPAKLSFDALQFYKPDYKPLAEPKLPPADAPWPTTPDTITPTPTEAVTTSLGQEGPYHVFTAKGPRDTIRWLYLPKSGTLDGLTVEVNGKRFQPCVGGGPVFERSAEAEPEGLEWGRDELTARWSIPRRDGRTSYAYRFRAKGKSLQITIECEDARATAFRIGHAVFAGVAQPPAAVSSLPHTPPQRRGAVPQPDLISVPYLTFGNVGPHVVQWDGVFLSGLLDWYNSDASQLFEEHGKPKPDEAIYNGGSRYLPKTDGKRNPLRERLILTVSSDFQEVLPNIPHPQNPMAHLATGSIWRNVGEPVPDLLKRLKAGGVERFICPLHEVGWRDAGESFTFRLRCAPRIGDEKMKEYGAWVKSLGYRFGLYANYTDYAPVNGNWREDRVCLDSDGNWRGAWPRCVAPKPTWAWQAEADLAPKIAEKFGAVTCYSDVHTAITPWDRTDYDARVPGAGMFRTTWACYARILWNECQAYGGPVFSEGRMHWMSAGLVSGNYAQITGPERWKVPPLVDFDLLRMHPLECDFGMGSPDMFYSGDEWQRDRSRTSPYFDRFITSTLAFGHIGFLPLEWGFDGALKAFYMTNAVQQLYALVPVAEIRYFDGSKLLTTSDAIRTGAYKRGQVYIKYSSGLELWCNLSFDHDWQVSCDGKSYLLPPTGHLAFRKGELLQFSALLDGQRMDYVDSPEYFYLDTRDRFAALGPIACRGAAALKPTGKKDEWWAIPCDKCEDLSIRPTLLGLKPDAALAAEAFDVDDKSLGAAEVRVSNLGCTIMPLKGAARYRLRVAGTTVAPPHDRQVRKLVTGLDYPIDLASVDLGKGTLREVRATVELVRKVDDREPGRSNILKNVRTSAVVRRGPEGHMSLKIRVPDDVEPGERLWYRVRVEGKIGNRDVEEASWFTGIVARAVEIAVRPANPAPHAPGSRQELVVTLRSNLPAPAPITLRVTAIPLGLTYSEPQTLREGVEHALTLAYTMPQEPAVLALGLSVEVAPPGVEPFVQVWKRWLRFTRSKAVVVDLAKLAPARVGIQFRGKAEEPLEAESGASFRGATNTVGGIAKAGFFCHPPYQGGVGYAFAEFPVTLPDEPCAFEASVGFADGSTTADGCVFSVQVRALGVAQPPSAVREPAPEKTQPRAAVPHGQGAQDATTFVTAGQTQFGELRKWKALRADLSKFQGKKVVLRLVTDVGPADDSNSDWACWGEPRVVLAGDRLLPEVFEKEPTLPIGPPPKLLKGLKAADLREVAEAKIVLDTAGVDGGEYRSDVYLNDALVGTTPASEGDTTWTEGQTLALPPEALKTVGPSNVAVIRNPRRDCMKVRRVHLWFRLRDGREGTSAVANGPFCSDAGWAYAEGEAVGLGHDLPAMECDIPVEP